MRTLLNENQIVEAVERAFSNRGYTTVSKCHTKQRGVDLHVQNASGDEWVIEAKGGTSAKKGNSKYGCPFDSAQISVHVAKAIHQAMALRASHPDAHVAIALPAEAHHEKEIKAVGDGLDRLGIAVIWVESPERVKLPSSS